MRILRRWSSPRKWKRWVKVADVPGFSPGVFLVTWYPRPSLYFDSEHFQVSGPWVEVGRGYGKDALPVMYHQGAAYFCCCGSPRGVAEQVLEAIWREAQRQGLVLFRP